MYIYLKYSQEIGKSPVVVNIEVKGAQNDCYVYYHRYSITKYHKLYYRDIICNENQIDSSQYYLC